MFMMPSFFVCYFVDYTAFTKIFQSHYVSAARYLYFNKCWDDKGSTVGRNFEYIRGKIIGLHGYPASSNINVHEITNEEGKEWT